MRKAPVAAHSTHFWLGPRPGARLIVYTPADSDSRDRLEKLAANL